MDSARWECIQEIYYRVSDLPASQHRAYLQKACEGDESLVAELLAMLSEDSGPASLLDRAVRRRWVQRIVIAALALKALLPRLRLDQRSIHREMLIR